MKKLIVVAIFLFTGCTGKYGIVRNQAKSNDINIARNSSAYISLPEDNITSGHLYVGSGKEVAAELEFLFSSYLGNVMVGKSIESCIQGLESAKTKGYDLHICPHFMTKGYALNVQGCRHLMQWEDWTAEWTGFPDEIRLKLSIQNTSTEAVIDTFLIRGKGKKMSSGGDHPLDFIKEPLSLWVKSLF